MTSKTRGWSEKHIILSHNLNFREPHGTNIVVVMRANRWLACNILEAVREKSSINPVLTIRLKDLILNLESKPSLEVIENHGSEESLNSSTSYPDAECFVIVWAIKR